MRTQATTRTAVTVPMLRDRTTGKLLSGISEYRDTTVPGIVLCIDDVGDWHMVGDLDVIDALAEYRREQVTS